MMSFDAETDFHLNIIIIYRNFAYILSFAFTSDLFVISVRHLLNK